MLRNINLTALIKTNIFFILILQLPCAIFATEGDMVVRQRDVRINTIACYNKSYAVCIGIDEYNHWRKLNYAVSDAEEVRDLLLSAGFEKVKLIKNGEATKRNILKALTWLGRVAGENDRVVIYYAGHGETLEGRHSKIGFILPVDCPKENYYMEAISMDKLKEAANYIKAKHILYLMDSCYSGIALNSRSDDAFAIAMTSDPVVYMITAGKAGEKALEMEGHGIFTNYFLRGLKGEADSDKNEVITGTEIGEYVRKWVVFKAKSKNRSQTPQFGQIDGEGEIVFVPLNKYEKPLKHEMPLPPEISNDDSYYEKIAIERAQAVREWDEWQKKMSSTYDKYLDLNGKSDSLTPPEKAQMWEQFLSTYATDNPYSTEDQMMRNNAAEKLDYWRNYKEPIKQQSTITQKPSHFPLHSSDRELSEDDVKSILKKHNMYDSYRNKSGEFQNDFELKKIKGGKVVIDHMTGLMWHQSGSDKFMNWNKAKQWVGKLNKNGYAGYNDWRLPTVEEAASLLEAKKMNGDLNIDPIFDAEQWRIWTGDSYGSSSAWYVHFNSGIVDWRSTGRISCVRPVRSGK